MNGLDLFNRIPALSVCSGIGGLEIGLSRWFRPIAYCERDDYAQGVLLSRIRDGLLPDAPIWDDLLTLRGDMFPRVGAIYGGPPCQDFSFAGAGAGLGGERGRLMFEFLRIVGECRPLVVVLENVPGFVLRGLDQVLLGLDALGYDCRWTIVSAEEVGAPFLGQRLFVMAKAAGNGRLEGWPEREQLGYAEDERASRAVGQAHRAGLERAVLTQKTWAAFAEHRHSGPDVWPPWLPVPALPRGHNGLRCRLDRIRCSGNAVVAFQAEEAILRLSGIK